MYSRLQLAQKYIHYYRTASNGKGHGIHSPFVFDFIVKVLNEKTRFPEYDVVEKLRRELQLDATLLKVEDLGAGSAMAVPGSGMVGPTGSMNPGGRKRFRKIADIARHAAKSPKWGQLLFRIARHYRPDRILELGTSLGLTTAYLAKGAPDAVVYTIEGAPAVAEVAATNFEALELEKIRLRTGNFDAELAPVLESMPPVDLAFVDGNHRRAPTLFYFNMLMERSSGSSVLIFDDIHWSAEMEEAWAVIRRDPRVFLTIDLFFIGLVFRREEFKVKQDFIIRF
jgi:predicted O-methyltransferase YrrM